MFTKFNKRFVKAHALSCQRSVFFLPLLSGQFTETADPIEKKSTKAGSLYQNLPKLRVLMFYVQTVRVFA
jgi:hypothetical protein